MKPAAVAFSAAAASVVAEAMSAPAVQVLPLYRIRRNLPHLINKFVVRS